MLVTGKEKAVLGGMVAGITTLSSQIVVNQQITLKEVVLSLVAWLLVHSTVWVTSNTSVQPPSRPIVISPPITPLEEITTS